MDDGCGWISAVVCVDKKNSRWKIYDFFWSRFARATQECDVSVYERMTSSRESETRKIELKPRTCGTWSSIPVDRMTLIMMTSMATLTFHCHTPDTCAWRARWMARDRAARWICSSVMCCKNGGRPWHYGVSVVNGDERSRDDIMMVVMWMWPHWHCHCTHRNGPLDCIILLLVWFAVVVTNQIWNDQGFCIIHPS